MSAHVPAIPRATQRAVPCAEPRVVIVADSASARFGGEAILPLHYFRRLRARGIEAWLVVHERVKQELQETLPNEVERIHVVPDLWLHRALVRAGERLPARVAATSTSLASVGLTQLLQRDRVRRLVRDHHANVVHVPTPVSPKTPSAIVDVGAPVVFGPMNGGMTYPPGFTEQQGRMERMFIRLGRAASTWANRVVPGKRQAAALLVANERTRRALPAGLCPNVTELVENGVDLSMFKGRTTRTARTRPRFVFLGRLVDWKAVDLLLEAMAQARLQSPMELHIVGDGPERAALQDHVRRLELGEDVVFHGFVPQHACPPLLRDADALVLPSLFECGGAVVLEAMAMELPVIATRWGGPADYLDEETGILVEPRGPVDFIEGLRQALVRLAESPALRAQLGERALERARELYDWERKLDRMLEVYRSVLPEAATGELATTHVPLEPGRVKQVAE